MLTFSRTEFALHCVCNFLRYNNEKAHEFVLRIRQPLRHNDEYAHYDGDHHVHSWRWYLNFDLLLIPGSFTCTCFSAFGDKDNEYCEKKKYLREVYLAPIVGMWSRKKRRTRSDLRIRVYLWSLEYILPWSLFLRIRRLCNCTVLYLRLLQLSSYFWTHSQSAWSSSPMESDRSWCCRRDARIASSLETSDRYLFFLI